MDFSQVMSVAHRLRDLAQQTQERAGEVLVTGEAAGGLVRVTMNGRYEVVDLVIDPSAVTDAGFVADLVRAAVNQASSKVAGALRERIGEVAESLGLDLSGLDLLGGLGAR